MRLPLDIGSRVDCQWRDGAFHTVRIIERRNLGPPGDPRAWDYYVHYIGCEWACDYLVHCIGCQ